MRLGEFEAVREYFNRDARGCSWLGLESGIDRFLDREFVAGPAVGTINPDVLESKVLIEGEDWECCIVASCCAAAFERKTGVANPVSISKVSSK